MSRLLEDLSTLAMAESGALRLHREPTDPFELVDEVVTAHRPEAQASGIDLVANGGQEAARPPGVVVVQIDPVRIREVLSNLIANALRYTPSGGRVTLAAELRGDDGRDAAVAFEVADTGPGIAPERVATVFDRFAKSAESRGAGLGLSIAKGLVEAHGGTIAVRSVPGRTVFTFVLPSDAASDLGAV